MDYLITDLLQIPDQDQHQENQKAEYQPGDQSPGDGFGFALIHRI